MYMAGGVAEERETKQAAASKRVPAGPAKIAEKKEKKEGGGGKTDSLQGPVTGVLLKKRKTKTAEAKKEEKSEADCPAAQEVVRASQFSSQIFSQLSSTASPKKEVQEAAKSMSDVMYAALAQAPPGSQAGVWHEI